MKISLVYVQYTVEVSLPEPPKLGKAYLDPRGKKWFVRGFNEDYRPILRNPPPPHKIWLVVLGADHPAWLEYNDELAEQ